ncbi:Uncharacterised protein [Mycobacteroides abscessus subsp. massiliense]|nr:Uncharacterised protein [Mycobacteroides abscessus subsp. massiliense]
MPYAPPTTKATATGAPKDGNRNPHHNSLATPAITAMTISPIQSCNAFQKSCVSYSGSATPAAA